MLDHSIEMFVKAKLNLHNATYLMLYILTQGSRPYKVPCLRAIYIHIFVYYINICTYIFIYTHIYVSISLHPYFLANVKVPHQNLPFTPFREGSIK